jgi:acyl dehydratase
MVIDELIGRELLSPWREIAQGRVDEFARATDDHQWIHDDPEQAAAGPFGTTIAHGFLTLSLVVPMFAEALPPLDGYGMTLNYGLNRVRFTSPVPTGSRIRGRFRIEDVEPVAGGVQARVAATIELEGQEKPACVAEALFRFLAPA